MSFPKVGLASIRRTMRDPITYDGAGLDEGAITAIFAELEADTFQGAGDTAKRVRFEIQFADLPGDPAKGDTIVHETGTWSVIGVDRRRDIEAFWIFVEEAEAP